MARHALNDIVFTDIQPLISPEEIESSDAKKRSAKTKKARKQKVPKGLYCFVMREDPESEGDYLDAHVECSNLSDDFIDMHCSKYDLSLVETVLENGDCCLLKCTQCLEACEREEAECGAS